MRITEAHLRQYDYGLSEPQRISAVKFGHQVLCLSLKKRYYIMFVSRDEDGNLNKVPVPLHYAYIFVAAAAIGMFTITGLAGSYSRMLIKTARFNQLRQDHNSLQKDYAHLEKSHHEKDIEVASLGSLASEVSAIYGLTASKLAVPMGRLTGSQGRHAKLCRNTARRHRAHRHRRSLQRRELLQVGRRLLRPAHLRAERCHRPQPRPLSRQPRASASASTARHTRRRRAHPLAHHGTHHQRLRPA